jgi:2-oxoglutarate ferredoxin oxidoreductase subunit gamma
MRYTDVIFAGFGGQGVLLAGKLLAHAAMESGLEVSWLPSYGPEMRGGTANVTVCISEHRIASPLITEPRNLVAMNQPSLDKFMDKVRPQGMIFVNTSLIKHENLPQHCTAVHVDTLELARQAGNERSANLVMLGAFVGVEHLIDESVMQRVFKNTFTGAKARWLDANMAAFHMGLEVGRHSIALTH